MRQDWKCAVLTAAGIAVTGLLLALGYNMTLARPLPLFKPLGVTVTPPAPAERPGPDAGEAPAPPDRTASDPQDAAASPPPPVTDEPTSIELAPARELWEAGRVIFLDARTFEEYEAGHIPGALALPYDAFEEFYPDVIDQLLAAGDRVLITYCSGKECEASVHLAEQLYYEGFNGVRVFFGGWPAWQEAGHEEALGPEPGN